MALDAATESSLREKLIDTLVLSPMSNHIGTGMSDVEITADQLLEVVKEAVAAAAAQAPGAFAIGTLAVDLYAAAHEYPRSALEAEDHVTASRLLGPILTARVASLK